MCFFEYKSRRFLKLPNNSNPKPKILLWLIFEKIASILAVISVVITIVVKGTESPDIFNIVIIALCSIVLIIVVIFTIITINTNKSTGEVLKEHISGQKKLAGNLPVIELMFISFGKVKKSVGILFESKKVNGREKKSTMIDIIDLVSEFFSKQLGNKVSICVKLFEENQETLKTVCRDSKSTDRNNVSKSVKVSECTAFETIMNGNAEIFAINDLIEYEEQLNRLNYEYKNPTPNWKRFYTTTIVVPIRREKENDVFDIIGFLCMDAKDINTFGHDDISMSPSIKILQNYADILYCYLKLTGE